MRIKQRQRRHTTGATSTFRGRASLVGLLALTGTIAPSPIASASGMAHPMPVCAPYHARVTGLAWSPTADQLLVEALIDGRVRIEVLEWPSMTVRTLVAGEPRAPEWLVTVGRDGVTMGDDGSAYWLHAVSGEEALERILPTGERRTLTTTASLEGVLLLRQPRWTHEGIVMLATSTLASDPSARLITVDPDNGTVRSTSDAADATLLAVTGDLSSRLLARQDADGTVTGVIVDASGGSRPVDMGLAVNSATLTSDGNVLVEGGLAGVLSISVSDDSEWVTEFGEGPASSVTVSADDMLAYVTSIPEVLSSDGSLPQDPANGPINTVCVQRLSRSNLPAPSGEDVTPGEDTSAARNPTLVRTGT